MKQVRIFWLALFSAVALAGVAASGASAAKFTPEWGYCHHVERENENEEKEILPTGGKYTDPGCTVVAKHKKVGEETVYEGEYEWTPASERVGGIERRGSEFGVRFGGTSTFTISTAKGYSIQCTSVGVGSKWNFRLPGSSQDAEPILVLSGCESENKACSTQELGIITIRNNDWLSNYGFIETGKHPIAGISFTAANPGERLLSTIYCEGPISTVLLGGETKGQNNSLVAAISPVNTMSEVSAVSFTQYGPGEQAGTLKGVKEHPLELNVHGIWEPASVSGVFEVQHEEVEELKASK